MNITKRKNRPTRTKRKTSIRLDFSPLEDVRHRADLTREDLASALGVTSITVWRWERNRNQPDLTQLIILARALGVPMNDLFAVKEGKA